MESLVSRLETSSFTPGNQQFHTEKPIVSCRETQSFKRRNKKFQMPEPGEQSAETALSKGLTKGGSFDYRMTYACKQQKTMGKKSYIFCYP